MTWKGRWIRRGLVAGVILGQMFFPAQGIELVAKELGIMLVMLAI